MRVANLTNSNDKSGDKRAPAEGDPLGTSFWPIQFIAQVGRPHPLSVYPDAWAYKREHSSFAKPRFPCRGFRLIKAIQKALDNFLAMSQSLFS